MVQPTPEGWYNGDSTSPRFYEGDPEMRRNISAKKHSRKHNRTSKKHRAINTPRKIPRGGRRL